MEYKNKEGMIDNRMVKDDHQQGIKRVLMRKGDLSKGLGGKLGCNKKMDESNFKRSSEKLSPRKA